MKYRIVNTDNFGGDYPNEFWVGEPFESRDAAKLEANRLNSPEPYGPNPYNPRYYKVVEEGYILQPGFDPSSSLHP